MSEGGRVIVGVFVVVMEGEGLGLGVGIFSMVVLGIRAGEEIAEGETIGPGWHATTSSTAGKIKPIFRKAATIPFTFF